MEQKEGENGDAGIRRRKMIRSAVRYKKDGRKRPSCVDHVSVYRPSPATFWESKQISVHGSGRVCSSEINESVEWEWWKVWSSVCVLGELTLGTPPPSPRAPLPSLPMPSPSGFWSAPLILQATLHTCTTHQVVILQSGSARSSFDCLIQPLKGQCARLKYVRSAPLSSNRLPVRV